MALDQGEPRTDLAGALTPLAAERTVENALARELRESILSGRLRPGVRLPYRELAHEFRVSVTPVRMALRELMTEGLVDLRPHGGATVAKLSIEELEELYSMRVGIESWLALQSAPALTEADIEAMFTHYPALERSAVERDRTGYLDAALEYRSASYAAARRPRLLATAASLYKRTGRYTILSLTKEYRFDQSLAYMRQYGQRCRERDGRGAQAVIREALEWSLAYISEALIEVGAADAP
jgi:DNA-binding GntR family transcriptional regulator